MKSARAAAVCGALAALLTTACGTVETQSGPTPPRTVVEQGALGGTGENGVSAFLGAP